MKRIGVQQVLSLRLTENLGPLVFQKKRHCTFGDANIGHKNTLERARLSCLPTPPAERARAPSLAFQRHNTSEKGLGEKGLGEDLNEKGQGQAQEMTC